MGQFAPFAGNGSARYVDDGKRVVGTMPIAADAGMRLISAEPVWDGTALVCVFEVIDE